jgi:hypothetical protein
MNSFVRLGLPTRPRLRPVIADAMYVTKQAPSLFWSNQRALLTLRLRHKKRLRAIFDAETSGLFGIRYAHVLPLALLEAAAAARRRYARCAPPNPTRLLTLLTPPIKKPASAGLFYWRRRRDCSAFASLSSSPLAPLGAAAAQRRCARFARSTEPYEASHPP